MDERSNDTIIFDPTVAKAAEIFNLSLAALILCSPDQLNNILGIDDEGGPGILGEDKTHKLLLDISIASKLALISELSSLSSSQIDTIIGMENAGVMNTVACFNYDLVSLKLY